MVTKKEVLNVLEEVLDPELGISVVDLGLIYDVKVDKNKVKIKMTLTSPLCPLSNFLVENIKEKVKSLDIKDVDVEIVFDPPWTPEKMSKRAKKILGIK
jgi:metal-sulfur cluster biosynthetic enzyme